MDTTRASLLERVKCLEDRTAWKEFFGLYFSLLTRFGSRYGLSRHDAEEVADECMEILVRKMPAFEYSRQRGRFKNFLYKLASDRIKNRRRRKQPQRLTRRAIETLASTDEQLVAQWDATWALEHFRFVLERVETEFAKHTVDAFKLYVLSDWPAEKVAETLDLSKNQVYLAKVRVAARLRREMERVVGDVL